MKPILYAPSFENIPQDEPETIAELVATLQSISETTAEDYGHAVRSVHAKSHGMLNATLTVKDDLPAELAQGLFAQPGKHTVAMRFSVTPGDILDDAISTPRGLAIKVFDVKGTRLSGDPANTTQDFLLVNGPAFLKPDAKSFLSSLKLLAKTTDKAEGLKKAFATTLKGAESLLERFGTKSPTIMSMGGHPETHVLGETFYSQVPLLYGKYMAKLAIVPISPALIKLSKAPVDLTGKPDGLRDAVVEFFRSHSAEWELRIQLCTDLGTMPIEDASVIWPEDQSPYLSVATLSADPQSAWDDAISPAMEDALIFSPWNGISEHRPIGSVMRARKLTYEMSAKFRQQFNGCPVANVHSMQALAEASRQLGSTAAER